MAERKDTFSLEWQTFDFEVALKVIQHISTGIYRSAGGVLKELVSNCYDSQATVVHITTDYPRVSRVRIIDDGWGLKEEVLKEQFSHIGASLKHREPEIFDVEGQSRRTRRKFIGMFGVGFLSAAHISKRIKLTTFPKGEGYRLDAEFDLSPYFDYASQVEPLDKFVGGTIRFKRTKENGRGSILELSPVDLDSPFRRFLLEPGKELVEWPRPEEDEKHSGTGASDLVDGIGARSIRTIDDLRGRERVLWELGLMAPVHYLPGGPIAPAVLAGEAEKVVGGIVQRVNDIDFRVFFDGVEVLKPIRLPTTKTAETVWDRLDTSSGQDFRVFPIDIDHKAEKKHHIRARGYLFFQPHRIIPQELTGIYPRVSGVGVGSYDSRFFRALRSENPIIRVQLSGELFIEEGLQDALTLDRSTFNEQDPEFIALREAVVGRISLDPESIVQSVHVIRKDRNARRRGLRESKDREDRRRSVRYMVSRVAPSRQTRLWRSDRFYLRDV